MIKLPGSPFSPWSPFVCQAQGCHRNPSSLVYCCFPSLCLRNKIVLNSRAFANSKRWDRFPPCLQHRLSGKMIFARGGSEMPGWLVTAACPFGARVVSPSTSRMMLLRMSKQPRNPPSATLWDHFGGVCPQPGSAGTAGACGRSPVPGPCPPALLVSRGTS